MDQGSRSSPRGAWDRGSGVATNQPHTSVGPWTKGYTSATQVVEKALHQVLEKKFAGQDRILWKQNGGAFSPALLARALAIYMTGRRFQAAGNWSEASGI